MKRKFLKLNKFALAFLLQAFLFNPPTDQAFTKPTQRELKTAFFFAVPALFIGVAIGYYLQKITLKKKDDEADRNYERAFDCIIEAINKGVNRLQDNWDYLKIAEGITGVEVVKEQKKIVIPVRYKGVKFTNPSEPVE